MSLTFDSARLPNPRLTPEHEQWRTQLRRFVDAEIMPHVEDWEEAGTFPEELYRKAADIGLLQLGYPERYGGLSDGIDLFHLNIVSDEMARPAAGGINASLLVHNIGLPPVVNFATEPVRETVAPAVLSGERHIALAITEPSGGSDVARLRTTARRDGDHYVVDGSKTFITGGLRAHWFTTAVRTGEEGAAGVSVLLIPADATGVSRTALDRKQGWWSSDTATIYFDNVTVPVDHLIGEENQGFRVIMHNFNGERLGMAASMEALSRVCLDEAVAWARERRTFGRRLADHQVIRHKISQMKQRINTTQTYLNYCTAQTIDGQPSGGDIALLKVQASETMEFCAREASQILGGASYLRGNRVERIYREVRVNAIGGGSEEILRDLAARQYGL